MDNELKEKSALLPTRPRTDSQLLEEVDGCLGEAKEIWDNHFKVEGNRQSFGKTILLPTCDGLVRLAIYLDQEKRKAR